MKKSCFFIIAATFVFSSLSAPCIESSADRIVFLELTITGDELTLENTYIENGMLKHKVRPMYVKGHLNFEVHSESGELLYEGTARDPSSLVIEYPLDDLRFEKTEAINESSFLSVRFPYGSDVRSVTFYRIDRVYYKGSSVEKEVIELGSFALDLSAAGNEDKYVFPVNDILINGDRDKRVDIVFLAEGYTIEEMNKFALDVQGVLDGFFDEPPFKEYISYFNVTAVEVPSRESGTDHPCTAPDCPPDFPKEMVNTYFNSTFDLHKIHNLLYVRNTELVFRVLQANTPDWDIAFVLVNTPWPGGGGGQLAVISASPYASEFALHEVGHSFASLADEYESLSSEMEGYEAPNVTAEVFRQYIRWNTWINASTPVPTPETYEYMYIVGLFEGAVYNTTGWYRPRLYCKMRAGGVPFGEVCREQITLSIFGAIGSAVDSYQPVESYVTIQESETVTFTVDRMNPVPNTVTTDWYFDGQLAASATDTLVVYGSAYTEDDYELTAVVSDMTPFVRNDPDELLKSEIIWNVSIEKGITDGSIDGLAEVAMLHQNVPNPFNPTTTVTFSLPGAGHVRVDVFDALGRHIVTLIDEVKEAGTHSAIWDGKDSNGIAVSTGIYFCRLEADASTETLKMVLIR